MNIREEQEKREHLILSPYASFSDQSRGRDREEGTVSDEDYLSERQRQDYSL